MGVGALLSILLGVVSYFVKKFLKFGAILAFQFAVTASTITFVVLVLGTMVSSLVFIYNKVDSLINIINTNNGQSLHCMMGLLNCAGLDTLIITFWNELFAIISIILVLRLIGFIRWGVITISNEAFKLAVLLGLA